jgi:Ca-activated chloride channel family protein
VSVAALDFARPQFWPLLLLVPALFLLLLAAGRARMRAAARFGGELAGATLLPGTTALLWTLGAGGLLLTWIEPRLGEEELIVERRGLDLVFCLDTSRSMLARDLEPSRLERAKLDIESILPDAIGGDRVGLVAFAGEARVVVPLTHDLDSFRELLRQVDTSTLRRGGSDLGAALRSADQVVGEDLTATTTVLLLTDGEDLAGSGLQAARALAARGIVVHAVGYGSTQGSKVTLATQSGEEFLRARDGSEVVTALDADGLRAIANACGGEFLRADAVALPLRELKTKRLDPIAERSYDAGAERQRRTRFQWVLLPVVLLLLWEAWRQGGYR